jgi:quercetin dioxygenase-like cupin family protein
LAFAVSRVQAQADRNLYLEIRLREIVVMMRNLGSRVSGSNPFIACAALCVAAAAGFVAAQDRPAGPPVLFRAPLEDMPGKELVVVQLTLQPRPAGQAPMGHRHPGSVYVYVTEGKARLGVEGQPVQEVPAGGSFFEAPGALHTVSEIAS